MSGFLLKTVISALVVALSTVLAKKSTWAAAVLIALPLTSILSMTWLWWETRDNSQVTQLCVDIGWLVVPSLSLFLVLPVLLKKGLPYPWALVVSTGVLVASFWTADWIRTRLS